MNNKTATSDMAVSGGNRIHPVSMDVLPSSTGVHRGTVATVTLDQLDLAASSLAYTRHNDANQRELAYNNLTLQELRYSSMRKKIPGLSSVPKNSTKMYVDIDPQTQFMRDLRQYIRQHFHMKECAMFVPVPGQKVKRNRDLKCHCGEVLMKHAGMQTNTTAESTIMEYYIMPKEIQQYFSRKKLDDAPSSRLPQVPWSPKSLRSTVTNAYGKINFVNVEHAGGTKPAKYIRMLEDDSIDDLLHLMKEYWKMMEPQAPHLVISVVGGAKNFKLDGRMRDTFSTGLIKAAKTTSAWLISSGFNMGVMKAVGQAVQQGQSFCWDNNRMAHMLRCIGIAPWGYVKGRKNLESLDGRGMFNAEFRTSNVILHGEPVPLNADHTHFIFVDDGYRNRYGGVAGVRAKLEQRISKPESDGGLGIPVVLVVVEGGTDAIADARKSLEHRIPVVVCSGTGRAADILAYAYSHTKTTSGGVREMREKHLGKLRDKIFEAYGSSWKEEDIDQKTENIKDSVQFCCQNADLMIVFNMNKQEDLDLAILSVLLKAHSGGDEAQRLSQLKLALMWNRVDIAQEEIFREDVLWRPSSLDDILTEAIETDKVKFMELILEQGVMMKEYLTVERLENFYLKVPKHHHIYRLLFQLTGKEELTRANVRMMLHKLLDRYDEDTDEIGVAELDLAVEDLVDTFDFKKAKFKNPYKHLMIWAVLVNRQSLAKYCWEMGDEPVTSGLAVTRLYGAIARRIARHESIIQDTIMEYKAEFELLATKVLEECHQKDPDKALTIVERNSPTWNQMTCLQLAASSNDQLFLASEACQNSISSIWKHGVLSGWLMIILATVCPPVIPLCMEIAVMGSEKMSWYQKLATYYTSPIAKFTYATIVYVIFLMTHTYMVLVDFQPSEVTPLEIFCVLWVFTYMVDRLHTFLAFPAPTTMSKLRDWYGVMNWLEVVNYLVCFVGFILHLLDHYRAAKVFYCVNSVVFFLSLTLQYRASAILGPKLVMIQRMMKELLMFIMVLLVFLLAYGVSSQSLLYHERSPGWVVLKDVFYYPYWQIFGELYIDELNTNDCRPGELDCRTFHWMVPMLLAAYLLVATILLLTLLIAVLCLVFNQVEMNSIEIWKYQMYFLVMEYDNKTFLVPPFSIVPHTILAIRWLCTCWTKRIDTQLIGRRHLEYLQLFEKENMANYLRHMKAQEMGKLETNIHRLQKRVDDLTKLIEDEVIADQQPDIGGLANTAIMSSDGRMLQSGMSVDSFNRLWPDVQQVISVTDKVANMEIPPEYYIHRPLKLRRRQYQPRVTSISQCYARLRNNSSAGIVTPAVQTTQPDAGKEEKDKDEVKETENSTLKETDEQSNLRSVIEPDIQELITKRETKVQFSIDTENIVEEAANVEDVSKEKKTKTKKEKKKKKEIKLDKDAENQVEQTESTAEETLKENKKKHKKEKKEKKKHRNKEHDMEESNTNKGFNNMNIPLVERSQSSLTSDLTIDYTAQMYERLDQSETPGIVRPKTAPVRSSSVPKYDSLQLFSKGVDERSGDQELHKDGDKDVLVKRELQAWHNSDDESPSRHGKSPSFGYSKFSDESSSDIDTKNTSGSLLRQRSSRKKKRRQDDRE